MQTAVTLLLKSTEHGGPFRSSHGRASGGRCATRTVHGGKRPSFEPHAYL